MLALLLVAVSLGLSNFAAAVSLGVAGVDARTRLRVTVIFGLFEAGMPVIGLLAGERVATQLGPASRWIGGGLLVGVGLYGLVASLRARRAESARRAPAARPAVPVGHLRLWLSGLALSLDNLAVGFGLGAYRVPVLAGAVIIGAVSVALSLVGLELGARLGGWAGRRADQLGGVILIAVGAVIATGALG
jgi:putative Mn2+ efflux pump MntP